MDERPGDGAGHAADLQDLPDPEPHVGASAAAPLHGSSTCPGAGAAPATALFYPPACQPAAEERGDPSVPVPQAGGGGEARRTPPSAPHPGSSGLGGPSPALTFCLNTRVMAACTAGRISSLQQCLQAWMPREGSPPSTVSLWALETLFDPTRRRCLSLGRRHVSTQSVKSVLTYVEEITDDFSLINKFPFCYCHSVTLAPQRGLCAPDKARPPRLSRSGQSLPPRRGGLPGLASRGQNGGSDWSGRSVWARRALPGLRGRTGCRWGCLSFVNVTRVAK